MGNVFEKICLQWLAKESAFRNLPITATNFGKWWDADPVLKNRLRRM